MSSPEVDLAVYPPAPRSRQALLAYQHAAVKSPENAAVALVALATHWQSKGPEKNRPRYQETSPTYRLMRQISNKYYEVALAVEAKNPGSLPPELYNLAAMWAQESSAIIEQLNRWQQDEYGICDLSAHGEFVHGVPVASLPAEKGAKKPCWAARLLRRERDGEPTIRL